MNELEQLLADVPVEIAADLLVLVAGIVRVVKAGDDPDARLAALMSTAESLKSQMDQAKFGPATLPQGG